jgi:hypothetical protein
VDKSEDGGPLKPASGQVRVKQVQLKDAYLDSMPWGSQDAFILPSANVYTPAGLSGLLGVASLSAYLSCG